MFMKPTHPTTRIEALGDTFLVEHVPDVVGLMGDDMVPVAHPQRPRFWRLTSKGAEIVSDADVERAILAEMECHLSLGVLPTETNITHFVKPEPVRRPDIEAAFWNAVIKLQDDGDVRRDGDCIVSRLNRSDFASDTFHGDQDTDLETKLRSLRTTLKAHGLTFRQEA